MVLPNILGVRGLQASPHKGRCEMSNEQLTRLPPPAINWQARAEEAEAAVKALKCEAVRREDDWRELGGSIAAQEDRDKAACLRVDIPPHGCDTSDALADEVLALRATIARVREVAERQSILDVSNGSWKAAARDVAGKVLRALEGGK
jgi:hypothetical protein